MGTMDSWVSDIPNTAQFLRDELSARRAPNGCSTSESETVSSSGTDNGYQYSCYSYSNCVEAGELCIYEGLGHDLTSGMPILAWEFLTDSRVDSSRTFAGTGAGAGSDADAKDGADADAKYDADEWNKWNEWNK